MNFGTSISLLVCFLGSVWSQSYMIQPPGKVGITASQTAPCGDGTTYPASILEVPAGTFFPVSWTDLPDGQDTNSLVRFSLLNSTEDFVLSVDNVTFDPNARQIRIPAYAQPGMYLLQWRWTTYYTCSRVNVTEAEYNVSPLQVSQAASGTLNPSEFEYFELELSGQQYNGDFLLVEATGPSGLTTPGDHFTVVAKEEFDYYPTLVEFDEKASTAEDSDVRMGLCRDRNNEREFFFGVIGGPQSTGHAYTIKVTAYDPNINSGGSIDSPAHNGNRYYRTAASSTFDTPRRAVLSSTSAFEDVPEFVLATNCEITEDILRGIQTSEKESCIKLPEDTDDKYLRVPKQTSSYTIKVETGTCDEIASASTLASSCFVLVCLLALLV